MRLYFTRHGESEANVGGFFWNEEEQYGLTDAGKAQAASLGDSLNGIAFAEIVCSPVLRARQTAAIIGERLGRTPIIQPGLWEWSCGIFEGQPYNADSDKLYPKVVQAWLLDHDYDARIEGGESYNEIAARFMPVIRDLESRYKHSDANVLVVSHRGALECMLPLICGNIDGAFALSHDITYATAIVVEYRDGAWVCIRWGEQVVPG